MLSCHSKQGERVWHGRRNAPAQQPTAPWSRKRPLAPSAAVPCVWISTTNAPSPLSKRYSACPWVSAAVTISLANATTSHFDLRPRDASHCHTTSSDWTLLPSWVHCDTDNTEPRPRFTNNSLLANSLWHHDRSPTFWTDTTNCSPWPPWIPSVCIRNSLRKDA
jgi:hypothetical protein